MGQLPVSDTRQGCKDWITGAPERTRAAFIKGKRSYSSPRRFQSKASADSPPPRLNAKFPRSVPFYSHGNNTAGVEFMVFWRFRRAERPCGFYVVARRR